MSLEYLRRNNLIRQFLHRFDERQWPEVVKLTVIFGIHSMKLNEREMQLLTIEKLTHLCAQASTAVSIHETLPTLEQTLEDLQTKISTLKCELENDPSNRPQPNRHIPSDFDQTIASLEADAPKLANVLSKVKHLNNKVQEARSQYSRQTVRGLQDTNGSVRQALSASERRPHRAAKPSQPKWKERPPPRLAYSVPQNTKSSNDADNDVVNSRFVDVPPTSRDLRKSGSQRFEDEDIVPVKEVSVHNGCTKKSKLRPNATKTKIPSYLQNVRSRIKERVQQDRIAAAEHRKNVRKSIQQAIAEDYPPSNSHPIISGRQTEKGSVLQISDSFLKNPLMKPFVGHSKEHDDLDLLRQSYRRGCDDNDLRSAPESVEELASVLRGWVNNDHEDNLAPGSSIQHPSEEILDSLRRLENCSAPFRQDNKGSAAPFDGQKEDNLYFESPFERQDPPEWDFSNTVFD